MTQELLHDSDKGVGGCHCEDRKSSVDFTCRT